jgi:hypothetical protein
MADVAKTDVNPAPAQAPAPTPAPSAQVNQAPVGTPPASEKPSPTPEPEKKPVPYQRFAEVIKQKNDHVSKIEELEKRLSKYEGKFVEQERRDAVETKVRAMVSGGMDEGVARTLVENLLPSTPQSQPVQMPQVGPTRQLVQDMGTMMEEFNKTHPDYPQYAEDMQKAFEQMEPEQQYFVVSNAKNFQLLYDHAKVKKLEEIAGKSFQAGAQSAYDTKGLKQAISGSSGAAAPSPVKWTREEVAKLSPAEYAKNRKEILEAFGVK